MNYFAKEFAEMEHFFVHKYLQSACGAGSTEKNPNPDQQHAAVSSKVVLLYV